tara:strand:- start:1745 stop:3427 length:1683 start_codon:yes stop_codon:yes gene_type:complete
MKKNKDIKKILDNKETTKKVLDSLNKHLPESSQDNEIFKSGYFYGLSIALPIINIINNPENNYEIEFEQLIKTQNINTHFFKNKANQWSGINALGICFSIKDRKLFWSKSFEDFINTREIKIIDYSNPMEDLVSVLLLSRVLEDCYFDKNHHLKAITSFISFDKNTLESHGISNSLRTIEGGHFLLKNEPKFMSKIEFKEDDSRGLSFTTNKRGYPYLKTLAREMPFSLLNETVNLIGPQANKKFLNFFKKERKVSSKLLAILYKRVDISDEVLSIFSKYFSNTDKLSRKRLLKELNRVPYNSFCDSMKSYKSLYLDNTPRIKTSPGLINELYNYTKKNGYRGRIISKQLGLVPTNKIFLPSDEKILDYSVEQVKSVHRLRQIGKELGNCLNNNYQSETYRRALKANNSSHFLYFKSNKKKSSSFLVFLEIMKKQHSFKVIEMKRRRNNDCTENDTAILRSFLISKDIAKIDRQDLSDYVLSLSGSISNKSFQESKKVMENKIEIITSLLLELYKHFPNPDRHLKGKSFSIKAVEDYLIKKIEKPTENKSQLKLDLQQNK